MNDITKISIKESNNLKQIITPIIDKIRSNILNIKCLIL